MSNHGGHHPATVTNMEHEDVKSSAEAKAERLKRIRRLANLSREELCAEGDINLATLISWEVGRFGGLSKKGASRVIERVAKEGVCCTPEWLLYGIGIGPEIRSNFEKIALVEEKENCSLSEKDKIIQELITFRKLNKNAIDFIINDDSMLPHYQIGDFVAGTKRVSDRINLILGLDCIIQTKDGLLIVRNLQQGPRPESFNLISTNLQSKVKDVILYDKELVSAAPIIWHRRFEPHT